MIRIVTSNSAVGRLDAAKGFVHSSPPSTEMLLLGASREAIDDFVREFSAATGATFGLHRFTLTQLAAHLAQAELAHASLAQATMLGMEAVAARTTFEALQAARIPYFAPVAHYPGFARALAATLNELRLAGVDDRAVATLDSPGPELAVLLRDHEQQLARAAVADRAALFRAATTAITAGAPFVGIPLLLLDVPLDCPAEGEFVAALVAHSPRVLVTVPAGDERTLQALLALRNAERISAKPAQPPSSLARLREYLFSETDPPTGEADDEVRFFSAPGEGRECVEIARMVFDEARQGVRFDQIAIVLRAPEVYSGLLENALRRANVPVYFARGTKRPDPSGRAFLALLACAVEGLSANRFAEYLSLGQVPALDPGGAPPAEREVWTGPEDEALGPAGEAARSGGEGGDGTQTEIDPQPDTDDVPVVAGTLRAPWKWEALLVEAAVIGGKDRWTRRLDGLASELHLKSEETAAEEPESPRLLAIQRELTNLGHLRRFALPVIEALDALPQQATWGEWLPLLQRLAALVLRHPQRALSVMAELQPMAAVGPVPVDEVREVLSQRLSTLAEDPPARRYGHVFVGTSEQMRGRRFEVVFVPGLAERIFPQKPREDPMLLDALRENLAMHMVLQKDRGLRERLQLQLAIGGARKRLYLSYPRIEVAEARPRVPSFYGLDIERAVRGRIPDFEELERSTASVSQARLPWPAPRDPARAIDEVEHDLAVLGRLLHEAKPTAFKGRARYLFELNSCLARSLRSRWARWESKAWSAADGLVKVTDATTEVLALHRLTARPYSVSALQQFASCPYRFLLSAIHHLEPRQEAVALERLDALTRGKIFHRVQAELLRELDGSQRLPVSASTLADALVTLDGVLNRIAEEYREELAPAILRVWQDEMEALRADLRAWLQRLAEAPDGWEPIRFEFGFGLPIDAERDSHSVAEPVTLAGGFKLRGAVDLIERKPNSSGLRVTDHKTGKDRTAAGLIVGGGGTLQPVLYSLAVEAATGEPVVEGRLFFCTAAGGFAERVVKIDTNARRSGREVLAIIDRSIECGFLPPAPHDDACSWCDFRDVCGPYEAIRVKRKDPRPLGDIEALRGLP
jgi:ATP-dependent helicase/nuclease subunit B